MSRRGGRPADTTGQLDPAEVARLRVGEFVLRARRVEAHSLAADRPALDRLRTPQFHIGVDPTGQTVAVRRYPPEEQVESAITRVRPLLLVGEQINFNKVMAQVGLLLHDGGLDPRAHAFTVQKALSQAWTRASSRDDAIRGYAEQHLNMATGESTEPISDRALALAYVYGDTVHADRTTHAAADPFGVQTRYGAAVHLVADLMVLTINALEFIRQLVARDLLALPVGVFDEVVTAKQIEQLPVRLYASPAPEHGAAGLDTFPRIDQPMPSDWVEIVAPPRPAAADPDD